MIYGSLCSGIEAASVAWHPLGWRAAFLSEVGPFPRAILKTRWPAIPLHGDFTDIRQDEYEPIDLLVGGTPCQSFSVAGLRGGLADDRGNLALEFLRLAQRLGARWLVWENVPGVLSSAGGRDFGAILGGLVELGYGFAYRVLDAQFFGVPQRRRRVFIVGYLGDWRRAAAVLFERHSLSGNPPPSREARERVAPTIAARTKGGGGLGTDFDCDGGLISDTYIADTLSVGANQTTGFCGEAVAHALNAKGGSGRIDGESETFVAALDLANLGGGGNIGHREDGTTITLDTNGNIGVAHSLRADGFDASEDGTGRGVPIIAFDWNNSAGAPNSEDTFGVLSTERSMAIAFSATGYPAAVRAMSVRRLTPRECERLQGFPDDYTLIDYRGKPAADGPRYKALGNSMAVPVMRWIGERIAMVEKLPHERTA